MLVPGVSVAVAQPIGLGRYHGPAGPFDTVVLPVGDAGVVFIVRSFEHEGLSLRASL